MNLLVNGDSLPAMRVRGICKAVDAAENFTDEDTEIGIVSYGMFSLYALMAGLIDNRIKFIEERNAPKSIQALAEKKFYNHNNIMAAVLPGMLREFDLDDLRSFLTIESIENDIILLGNTDKKSRSPIKGFAGFLIWRRHPNY